MSLVSPSAFDVVAIATSAGGVEAVSSILGSLPRGFPAALVVAQHLRRNISSALPSVLQRGCALRVKFIEDGESVAGGTVYISPPDVQSVVDTAGRFALIRTPLLHFVRPVADSLFISMAFHFRARCLGLVLTGSNTDAAAGAWSISYAGGMVLVQDSASSAFARMPESAVELGGADFVLPLSRLGLAVATLVMRPEVASYFRRPAGPRPSSSAA
jgi:two-component system chemotaxis response regulator CheB